MITAHDRDILKRLPEWNPTGDITAHAVPGAPQMLIGDDFFHAHRVMIDFRDRVALFSDQGDALIAPGGYRAAIDQLAPAFEQKTGYKVKATIGSGGGTKDRVIKGEDWCIRIGAGWLLLRR